METNFFYISTIKKTMLTLLRVMSLFTALVLISCHHSDKEFAIEKALLNLGARFPELPKVKANQTDLYKLVRSVTVGGIGVELQLRRVLNETDKMQSVVLVLNNQKDAYCFPLYSNKHRDYWNFSFDTTFAFVKPVHSTFQRELQNCLDTLRLNDTLGTAGKVIDEMLVSLLQCRYVYESDSVQIKGTQLASFPDLPEESLDDCQARVSKCWTEILKGMHPKENETRQFSFWDEHNGRVYQFGNYARRKTKLKVGVNVYRQDCVFHEIYL